MAKRKSIQTEERYVAAYLRVSTEGQAINGHSLDAQYQKCYQVTQLKDLPSPRFFIDEGVSGSIVPDSRPKMSELIEDIKAGKVSTVIAYSLDRIGRKAQHILNFVALLEDYKVELYIVRESLDTSTAHGKFALTILAAMAQLERDYISERTKEALDAIERKGGYKGGRLPYGFVLTENGVQQNEQTYNAALRILQLHGEGKTLRAIAEIMNSENVPTPKGGKVWYASTVKAITDNKAAYQS